MILYFNGIKSSYYYGLFISLILIIYTIVWLLIALNDVNKAMSIYDYLKSLFIKFTKNFGL